MLDSKEAMATIAVKDLAAARRFYEGILGFTPREASEKGTAVYDMPGMKLEGDVHVMPNMKAAWFKDPDGNILAIVSG